MLLWTDIDHNNKKNGKESAQTEINFPNSLARNSSMIGGETRQKKNEKSQR